MSNERIRLSKFTLPTQVDPVEIIVNLNPRFNIGYRATIRGKPGVWGDSPHSPEEALGILFMNWILEEK